MPSWSRWPTRVQGYFVWAKKVLEGAKGMNALLEQALEAVFAAQITLHGQSHPVIPKDTDLDAYLDSYYKRMSLSTD